MTEQEQRALGFVKRRYAALKRPQPAMSLVSDSIEGVTVVWVQVAQGPRWLTWIENGRTQGVIWP